MAELVVQLGLLFVVATALAILARILRQPPLVGYIFTGLLLGWVGVQIGSSKELIDVVSEIGIVLLLFVVGLEINLKKFLQSGKHTFLVGEGHDITMGAISLLLAHFVLGLDWIASAYVAIAVTLASTIVVVKTLTERKEIEAPHGRILIGMMVLQDILAMIALAVFTGLAAGGNPFIATGMTLVKAVGLFLVMAFLGKQLMTRFFDLVSDHIELIFFTGLSWCFAGVLIADYLEFSIAIGAFLAGMSIAHLPFAFEIADKTRALRDFGLFLFFFAVGATAKITPKLFIHPAFIVLTLLVLVGTPLITALITSFLRYEKKQSFLMATMPVQVSEFSLVLMAIGVKLGHVSEELFSIITAITILTIIVSSGIHSNIGSLYGKLEPHLKILEWRIPRKMRELEKKYQNHVVLLGAGDLAYHIAEYFIKKKKVPVVVVDWDPGRIKRIKRLGAETLYGDAGDPDVWEEVGADKAKIIISTIGPNQQDDINMYRWVKKRNKKAVMIGESNVPAEVKELERLGFDYVLWQDHSEWDTIRNWLEKKVGK